MANAPKAVSHLYPNMFRVLLRTLHQERALVKGTLLHHYKHWQWGIITVFGFMLRDFWEDIEKCRQF